MSDEVPYHSIASKTPAAGHVERDSIALSGERTIVVGRCIGKDAMQVDIRRQLPDGRRMFLDFALSVEAADALAELLADAVRRERLEPTAVVVEFTESEVRP